VKFELKGRRLKGTWVLIRLRRGDPDKPQWLLLKHDDAQARPGSDVVAKYLTSVASRRTMEQIARDRSRVWGQTAGKRASRAV
jgi:bifunctional non-homologous end joining protein LigD